MERSAIADKAGDRTADGTAGRRQQGVALTPPSYGIAVADAQQPADGARAPELAAADGGMEVRRPASPPPAGPLLIGAADDPAEGAADALAARILAMPAALPAPAMIDAAPMLRRKCDPCETEERLRRLAAGDAAGGGPAPASVGAALAAPGHPLDGASRAFFEPRFGRDLGTVRVHADAAAAASARDVGAIAYTVGRNIVFGEGRYAPQADAGRRLLAHELAHVIQGSGSAPPRVMRQPAPGKGGIMDQLPSDDWRVLGAQAAPLTDEDLVLYLTRYGGLDAAVIKASTPTAEPATGPDSNRIFRHPTKGEVARVLIRRITSGSTASYYVFLWAPKSGGGTGKAPPSPPGTTLPPPSPPPGGPGKTPPGSTTGSPVATTPAKELPPLSLPELQARLTLIEAAITKIKTDYEFAPKDPEPALCDAALANVKAARQALTGAPADVERITDAERIVERIDRALDLIDVKLNELETAPGLGESRKGYEKAIAEVQLAYFQALSKLLTADQAAAFNEAEKKAAGLPRALIEAELKRYEKRKPTYELVEYSRTEIVDWVGSVRTELDALEKLTADLGTARANNAANVSTLEAAVNAKAETVQLSLEAIGHWDRVRQAFKYLADERNLIPSAYRSIGRLIQRCVKMKEAAKAGKLDDLRARVKAYRDDPAIAEFYKGLPIIAFGSRFLVSLAITLVATLVTAGVGGLVAGGTATGSAAATGAAATGLTARTALAFAGTAALEALTFTAVSTTLNYAVLGQKVTPGGVAKDLLWNLGLFGALKGMTIGVGKAMVAAELPALAGTAAFAGSLPLLHYYGKLRFRLEEGRWMTQAEAQMASAEMIIMAAGLFAGTAAMKRWLKSNRSATELAKFERDYGFRFTEIEAGRQRLINEVADLVARNKADDKVEMDKIRDKARKLEDIAKEVVKEIEGKVNLTKLRTELELAGRALEAEGSSEALAKVVGVDIDTGLKRGGGERTFTYAWGKTKQLELRLRALKAQVEKTVDAAGLRRIKATFEKQEPLTFQERADPVFGEKEVEVNPADPAITAFVAELKLSDPAAIRTVVTMITAQLARSPKNGLNFAIGQVRAELKTRLKTTPGATMESLVLEARTKGVAGSSAPAALVAEAAKQAGGGLLDDPVWKEKRTLPDYLGVLAERLGRDVATAPKTPGGRVLANVIFTGDQFTDAAGTKPRTTGDGKAVVDTTVSELDFMGVSGTGADVVVETMANVKAGTGKGGAAAVQNENAQSALKGLISGNLVPIKDGAAVYYARVKSVTAVDATGTTVDLTGKLKQASGGIKTETIGPKGARGYDRPLPYTEKELKTIVELLREMQMRRAPDY
ncbi:MAG: DUF4157 domain-containing protein [Rhodospirillales bacterium]|nr:DUF4157 domain-containing protein [Rhodospirillales bacterium]